MPKRAHELSRVGRLVSLLVGISLLTVGSPVPSHVQGAPPGWQDSGVALATPYQTVCLDAVHPHVLVLAVPGTGTVAYNWQIGQHTVLNAYSVGECGLNGLLFAPGMGGSPAVRFTVTDPTPIPIAHLPTQIAADGGLQVYAFDSHAGMLWASGDGGLTWDQRFLPGRRPFAGFLMAQGDAHAVYALDVPDFTGDPCAYPPPPPRGFTLYFSPDAGRTWEVRHSGSLAGGPWPTSSVAAIRLVAPAGEALPATTVLTQIEYTTCASSHYAVTTSLSWDGGRTWQDLGTYTGSPEAAEQAVQFAGTSAGLLQWAVSGYLFEDRHLDLLRPGNGGMKAVLRLPPVAFNPSPAARIVVPPGTPAQVFLTTPDTSWESTDGGVTWQPSAAPGDLGQPTPYLPGSWVSLQGGHIYTRDRGVAGAGPTIAVPDQGGPDNVYFASTGHNLAGPFRHYWESHGGLAQFGYPRTESFLEVNSADGKVYRTQYFERSRFEYHPELAGTPDAVQLGLLGVRATESYRAIRHGAFNRFADLHYPGAVYFPQTGHNLRNSFLAYWQAHGGLTIHGYPISEEFDEVSPDDGHPYVMQYFERSRFEWHPGYRGTPAEVLLGLLGNRLIELQGWH